MSETMSPSKETDILSRLQLPLTPEAAEGILKMDFSEDDKERMRELLDKGNEGTRTLEENAEADDYERIGHLIGMLKSVARQTLKQSS